MGQMISLNALAKSLAIAHHAADGDAAKVHPVVALFAADQPCFCALSLGPPIGASHFE